MAATPDYADDMVRWIMKHGREPFTAAKLAAELGVPDMKSRIGAILSGIYCRGGKPHTGKGARAVYYPLVSGTLRKINATTYTWRRDPAVPGAGVVGRGSAPATPAPAPATTTPSTLAAGDLLEVVRVTGNGDMLVTDGEGYWVVRTVGKLVEG